MSTIVPFRPTIGRRTAGALLSPRRLRFIAFVFFGVLMAAAALLTERRQGAQAPSAPHDGRSGVSIGLVSVTDGDTLRMGRERIRILGIDAPELSQICRDEAGRQWACGREARERLRTLIGQNEVSCVHDSLDRYGRTLAICSAGAITDIGEALVREGYAVEYSFGRARYRSAEAEARVSRRGIWRGNFERPQDWRAQSRSNY
jgi:endonuclease YncB( thermonuclease family)